MKPAQSLIKIEVTASETAIVPYGGDHGTSLEMGNLGSVVLDSAGGAVAIMTGGDGTSNDTDGTFATAYTMNSSSGSSRPYPSTKLLITRFIDSTPIYPLAHNSHVHPSPRIHRFMCYHQEAEFDQLAAKTMARHHQAMSCNVCVRSHIEAFKISVPLRQQDFTATHSIQRHSRPSTELRPTTTGQRSSGIEHRVPLPFNIKAGTYRKCLCSSDSGSPILCTSFTFEPGALI